MKRTQAQEEIAEREAPHSPEAEKNILGSVLVNPETIIQTDDLYLDDFFFEANRKVFAAMRALFHANRAIDIVTVSELLTERKEVKAIGGVSMLSALMDGVPHIADIGEYVKIVQEHSRRRRIIAAADKASTRAFKRGEGSLDIIGELEREMMEIVGETEETKAVRVGELAVKVWREMADQKQSKKAIVGYRLGLPALDESIGGIRPGEIVVVAARPGGGKSAFMVNAAVYNAKVDGVGVGVFSLEMSATQLIKRALSAEAKINNVLLRNPDDLGILDLDDLAVAAKKMHGWPLEVDESGGLTVEKLISRAKLMYQRGARLFFIDYLQKIEMDRREDPRRGTNHVCESLRRFAKHYGVAIVELSALSRFKDNSLRKPTLADLKESGNIEQDAHIVLFPHRDIDKKGNFTGADEIIVAKNREGPTGHIKATYEGETLEWKPRFTTIKPKTDEEHKTADGFNPVHHAKGFKKQEETDANGKGNGDDGLFSRASGGDRVDRAVPPEDDF